MRDQRQQGSPSVNRQHAMQMDAARRRRLASAIAFLVLATVALSLVAAGPGVVPGDVWIARELQRIPAGAGTPVTDFAYWLGSFPALSGGALVIAAAFAGRRHWLEAVLLLGTMPVRGINPLLKRLLASPRPTDDLVRVTEQARGMGFPSGHSMGVALLYGLGAFLLGRRITSTRFRGAIWAVAGLLIAITGFGRIYSGAHWPSDVLGGYLWASIVALVMLGTVRLARIG